MKRHISLLLLTLTTFGIHSLEVCDEASSRCAKVGSAAAWLLSIIETSTSACPPSDAVNSWLRDSRWLTEKVKHQEPEYNYFVEMQLRSFWDKNNPEFMDTCDKVAELVSKSSPLNEELR